jgi:hypothetical protein
VTKTEMQAEALANARNGVTMTNYPAIFAGFIEKGIPEHDIKPRENVFTFNAWKALGRSVKKGEHGVRIVTFIEASARDTSEAGEETVRTYRQPHSTTVFHISQTEPTAEREARAPASGRTYRGWRREGNRQVPDHRDYVRDPGEDAADRWNETHY